jgi:hypothetical protein
MMNVTDQSVGVGLSHFFCKLLSITYGNSYSYFRQIYRAFNKVLSNNIIKDFSAGKT